MILTRKSNLQIYIRNRQSTDSKKFIVVNKFSLKTSTPDLSNYVSKTGNQTINGNLTLSDKLNLYYNNGVVIVNVWQNNQYNKN